MDDQVFAIPNCHENMVKNLTAEKGNDAYANVRAPDRTYSDTVTVELGGKSAQMIHALPSHSDDSSIIYFPDERAVFAVDFVNVRRLPCGGLRKSPRARWRWRVSARHWAVRFVRLNLTCHPGPIPEPILVCP